MAAIEQKQNKTVAVVVTYNRLEMLKENLSKLEKQTRPCDVLVVNNASTDDTAQWLETYCDQHKDTTAHTLPTNIGGAGGFNHGMRWGVENGYDYIWVMDDDCFPNPDALEKLLEADALLEGDYGWLSSVALWTDGTECKMNRQKLRKDFYKRIELLRHGIIAAEQATFVSCFFRADTICVAGLPITDFFIWGDDIEYTRRISVRMQRPCYVCGQSVVTHAMASNNGSSIATDGAERIGRYNNAFRNENYLYRKEGIKGFAYYFAKCGLNGIRILRSAKDYKAKRCGVIVKQFFAGLFFNPRVEYPHQEIPKNRK